MNCFETRLPKGDVLGLEVAAVSETRSDCRPSVEDSSGLKDHIAARFSMISEDRTKFAKSTVGGSIGGSDSDRLLVEAKIGHDRSGAQMRIVAQYRIADVIVVRSLDIVHEHAVLVFAGVAEDAVAASDNIAADIDTRAKLTTVAYPGGPSNGAKWRELCFAFKKYLSLDVETGRDIGRDA
tara:strand:- start:22575 stop:23117 length:543 start_codon:yes stop_codon:yes gene_type:complete